MFHAFLVNKEDTLGGARWGKSEATIDEIREEPEMGWQEYRSCRVLKVRV